MSNGRFKLATLMTGLAGALTVILSGSDAHAQSRHMREAPYSFTEFDFPTAAVCQAQGGLACMGPTNLVFDADGEHLWVGMQFGGADNRGGIARMSRNGEGFHLFNEGLRHDTTVTDFARGPDGNFYFTDFDGGTIGRMTPQGVFTQWDAPGLMNAYPNASPQGLASIRAELMPMPYEIVAGRDGDMWFSAQDVYGGVRHNFSTGYVGRFAPSDPAGTMRQYPLPGLPSGIIVGADGEIWVIHFARWTDKQGGGISRINAAGDITTYDLPFAPDASESERTYGCAITTAELAIGPDGNIWFTQEFCRQVGRFNPRDGSYQFYTVPAERTHMVKLIAGRDGAMYVGDYNGFWRINMAGEISAVNLPQRRSGGWAVVEGPDRNLWFTHRFSDTVGRLVIPAPRR